MESIEATQLFLAATAALVLERVGLALPRHIERRSSGLDHHADDRLRVLKDECPVLRQSVAELQQRQEFTERALLQRSSPREHGPVSSPTRACPDAALTSYHESVLSA